MDSKKELQQKIDKALELLQSTDRTEKELEEIKASLEQNRKEVLNFIRKNLHKASQEELHNWLTLIEFLEEKDFAPYLKELFYRDDIALQLKQTTASLLETLGASLANDIIDELEKGQALLNKLRANLKESKSKTVKKQRLNEFLELSEFLQLSLLNQLISEADDKALALLNNLFGSNEGLDEFLIYKLGDIASDESVNTLNEWLEKSDNKSYKKLIKKSLYKLKLKGIEPALAPRKTEPLKLDVPAEDIVYASHIDAVGERFLLMAREELRIGLRVFQVFISAEKGIFKLDTGEMRGRDFKLLVRRLQDENKIMLIQIDPDYCHFLLEEAAQVNKKSKNPLPDKYEQLKSWLKKPGKAFKESLIYSLLPGESVQDKSELVEKSAELLTVDPFRGWTLPSEEIEKYVEQFKEAVDSRLLLSPIQQQERLVTIYQTVTDRYFTTERRKQFRRHLEEMAYMLFIKGKKKAAKMSLATAIALEKQAPTFIPFIVELVKRSIFFKAGIAPKEEIEPEKKEDSRIIIPSEKEEIEKRKDSGIVIPSSEVKPEKREDSGLIIPPGEIKRK